MYINKGKLIDSENCLGNSQNHIVHGHPPIPCAEGVAGFY